ncbi:MAG TPA: penicillin acylase family protein [Thermoleophilaceae bacterium]
MRRGTAVHVHVALLALCALLIVAAPAAAAGKPKVRAEIKRTAYGIPHIKASNYEGIAFGYAYALAQDNICELADIYTTVRAERSRYFDPQATYASRGNGATFKNIDSDFFFQRAIDTKIVEGLIAKPPPEGPLPILKEAVRGYAAGYNKYLKRIGGPNGLDDPRCKGKDWVKPITEMDVYRRFWQLGILASQGVAIDGIATAAPLAPGVPLLGGAGAAANPAMLDELGSRLGEELGIGSNAVGVGSEGTRSGGGLLLGNPHFPWDGSERFYQTHLTIPGKLNVTGGSLLGVPIVLIGHTDKMAWSHTVSTARRFLIYELKLVPGSPTSYIHDGQVKQMKADNVTIQVRNPEGGTTPQTRTLYSSEHGSILTSILGLPVFPWTAERAYAMDDANASNFRYLNHFFEVNHAQSVRQVHAIENRYQGIPWVNTIAADKKGEAYYADIGSMPNLPNEKLSACEVPVGTALRTAAGVFAIDGSRGECDPGQDPTAVAPGILGPDKQPFLFRRDYVENSNDSYWLTNPKQPLEGYPTLIGPERTARALRTRLGLRIIQQRLDGTDGRPGTKFGLADMTWAVFNNRQYAGELWRDEAVAMCNANASSMPSSKGPVNVADACPVLAAWNVRDDLDSKGAILARRFINRARAVQGGPYRRAFDPADPVNTPSGLNTENTAVQQAFGDAVNDLRDAGIPLDAPLRGYQYEMRGDKAFPIHGGPGTDGVFNAINVSWSPPKGYPNIPHGSSFVQVVHFPRKGCAEHRTILTYSQSTNPNSKHFSDQTSLFSKKRWVNPPFCASQLRKAKGSTQRLAR